MRGAPGRTPFASRPGGCPPRPHDSRHKTALAVVLAVALLAGSWLIEHGAKDQKPPPQPSRAEAFPTPGEPLLGPRRDDHAVPPLPSAAPTRVRIPGIQVDAPMTPLTLGPDGTLTSPPEDDGNLAGWYAAGTPPGAAGTAVVAGHVDLANGPAVFYNLGALKKGDTVEVARADALTAVFTIDAIEVYDRSDFPSEKVYGTVGPPGHGRAELRVITCGGGFSAEADEYLGNVVVYAHLTGVRHPPGLLS
ncbi:class F sortase [Streptomyces sp. UNOB3_S3]|nr:class F sortase [Streptomyces sp. UNOB3_S3]